MNEQAIQEQYQHIVDFSSFRAAACQAKSPIKTLDKLDIEVCGEEIRFIVDVHINRLFDFAGAADKHVLHIHVDADGAVPVGVISRRRAVVRRAAITGNQHEHGAQKS